MQGCSSCGVSRRFACCWSPLFWLLGGLPPSTHSPWKNDAQSLEEYRLGSGDRLGILVFGHADVSGVFQIDGLGRISMPLLGQVDANGKTVAQLQEIITQMLNVDFIVDPRVSIEGSCPGAWCKSVALYAAPGG